MPVPPPFLASINSNSNVGRLDCDYQLTAGQQSQMHALFLMSNVSFGDNKYDNWLLILPSPDGTTWMRIGSYQWNGAHKMGVLSI